jgi:hypothetical protein
MLPQPAELARNYWDEMGRGMASAMHGPMLARLADALELDYSIDPVPEAVALSNLLAGLAFNRRYAFHAVGALGVVELTAPDRTGCVNRGLKRLQIPARDRQYYALHSTLDIAHSRSWNLEIITPLVREDPARAVAIAEGALDAPARRRALAQLRVTGASSSLAVKATVPAAEESTAPALAIPVLAVGALQCGDHRVEGVPVSGRVVDQPAHVCRLGALP